MQEVYLIIFYTYNLKKGRSEIWKSGGQISYWKNAVNNF